MEERLVNFKTAELAKEKGFKIPVIHGYNSAGNIYIKCHQSKHYNNVKGDFSAPTQSLLQKWLIENHNIYVKEEWFPKEDGSPEWGIMLMQGIDNAFNKTFSNFSFNDYYGLREDAIEKACQEGLKLIKNDKS